MNKHHILLILLITISFVLRLIHLNYPPKFYFDENYDAFTAEALLNNNPNIWKPTIEPVDPPKGYQWHHPPLSPLLIAASIKLLGNQSWVWRIPSILAGTLSIFVVYLIGKKAFSKTSGLIAASLLAFDGISLAQSRIAMSDSILVFFILVIMYASMRKRWYMAACCFGLALSTKWTVLVALPLIMLLFTQSSKKQRKRKVFTMVLLTSLVYLVSYYSLFQVIPNVLNFINLQIKMVVHAITSNTQIHPLHSPWWQWLLGTNPALYFSSQSKQIWLTPNIMIFWIGLVALSITLITKSHSITQIQASTRKFLNIFSLGYLLFLVPWIVRSLPILPHRSTYLYYYLPSLPFLHLISGYWIAHAVHRRKTIIKTAAIAILTASFIVFLAIYPKLVGL